jgi:tagatose-1,6-bisphosphate aldolase
MKGMYRARGNARNVFGAIVRVALAEQAESGEEGGRALWVGVLDHDLAWASNQ